MKAYQRSNFGTLGIDAKNRLSNDNDIKILVVGANSQTGIGKTTMAIQLCRYIDDEWSADEKAFIDINEYLNAYLDVEGGSALLLDEIEHGADSRRSTSKENVELSQGWAKLRARNVATVATLPSISMLDKRMIELADYQVIVKRRGLAQPFKINVNDFKPNKLPSRQPIEGDEHIKFVDLPDSDPDKRYLDAIKDDIIRTEGPRTIYLKEHKEKLRKQKKKAVREFRNEVIYELNEHTDLSQNDIAAFEWCDVKQSAIARIVSSMRTENDA